VADGGHGGSQRHTTTASACKPARALFPVRTAKVYVFTKRESNPFVVLPKWKKTILLDLRNMVNSLEPTIL
jgi:hypothetical protein